MSLSRSITDVFVYKKTRFRSDSSRLPSDAKSTLICSTDLCSDFSDSITAMIAIAPTISANIVAMAVATADTACT